MKQVAKRTAQVLVSLATSGVFVWLSLRGVDLDAVGRAFLSANYAYLVLYLAVLAVIHLLRTVRWGLLLEPLGKLSFRDLNTASGVGFMALVLLPLRLGEFARSYVLKRIAAIRMSASMATVVVERVVDMIAIALLVMATLLRVRAGGDTVVYLRAAGALLFVAFALVAVGLVLAYRHRERAVRLLGCVLHPVSSRLAHRVCGLLDSFIHGLRVVPSARTIGLFMVLTAAYWGINAFGLVLMGRAFAIELGFREALTVLAVQVVGAMIPAGPGMLGTFQFFTMFGLSLFVGQDAMRAEGAAYANALWAMQFGQQVAFGLVLLSLSRLGLGSIVSGAEEVADEVEREGEAAEHAEEVAEPARLRRAGNSGSGLREGRAR